MKMQQGSSVSETPASGAGPEQPFPWASFPPCSCSELPPAREHRTDSLGPCGRAQMCTARFPGLRSTQIPTNDPPCARPRAGTANTDRAPMALIPGNSQAPAPAEATPHPGTASIHRASGSKHITSQGLRAGVLGAALHPDTCALLHVHHPHVRPSPPTLTNT